MPLNAKDARIFIKFNTDGTREDTRIEGANLEILIIDGKEIFASNVYVDGTYDELDSTGYVEINYKDYMLYCGNSPDGKEYVRNMETGEPMEKSPYVQPLEELKEAKIKEAGALFAQKRDAIRQVTLSDGNTYGFDTANEDITNFMASWKAAEMSNSTMYKVWLADGSKGLITMQLADFETVFNAVRTSQLEAYAWYGTIDAQIQAATTKEELETIVLE